MLCRKACTFFSLVLTLISATGYACAYGVYTAQNNAVILQSAAEHTEVVLADSGMSAPKPECNEIKTTGRQQSAPLRNDGGFNFHICPANSGCILQYRAESAYLPLQDAYTQFENKYRDTILTLQTLK
ncbi:MAG TPA: hypothetical protein DCL73_09650 [Treponema sp.]|nr:hypothetical protein [Treponema sp.]